MCAAETSCPKVAAAACRPLKVAWFSFFPVEWMPDSPESVRRLPRGHAATWQQVLAAELEPRPDFKLHVIVLRKEFERDLDFDLRGISFHLRRTVGGLRAPSFFWHDTWIIRRALRQIQPDVVHAWGTEHGAALVAARCHYPYVLTMQGLLSWYATQTRLSRYHRFAAKLERWSVPRAPVVTTESRFGIQYLERHFPGPRYVQVEHAPKRLFHELRRHPQTQPAQFLFVGAFGQIKGGDLLLQALDQVKAEFPFEMLIVSGRDEAFLQRVRPTVSAALWDRVRFEASLTSEQVAEKMASATMMIFPTRADTSPNSVKEAVVAGLPVVASAVGGIVDYVFPEKNGLLVPSGQLAPLADAIRAAVRHPLFGQGQVDAATLAAVREYLSPRLMGERFMQIYRELAVPRGTGKS